jgi:hypothetical protein
MTLKMTPKHFVLFWLARKLTHILFRCNGDRDGGNHNDKSGVMATMVVMVTMVIVVTAN